MRDKPLYQLQHRGFAYAVCPDYPDVFAAPNVHIKAFYKRALLVAIAHAKRAVYHPYDVLCRLDVVFKAYLRRLGVHKRLVHALYPVKHMLTRFRHFCGRCTHLIARDVVLKLCDLLLLRLKLFELALVTHLLLYKIGVVIALVAVYPALLYLAYARADLVDEVPVVRNYQKRALVAFKMILQPHQRLKIKVVRRLVKYQQIRLLKQQLCKRQPRLFTARESRHNLRCICVRKTHTVEYLPYAHVHSVAVARLKKRAKVRILLADAFKLVPLSALHKRRKLLHSLFDLDKLRESVLHLLHYRAR